MEIVIGSLLSGTDVQTLMESISLFPVHDNHHQLSTFVKDLYRALG